MNSKSKNALNLFYQWFGKRAYLICGKPGIINKPGVTSCSGCGAIGRLHSSEGGYHSFCDVCVTVAGSYDGVKRPGRLGAGWAAIITPDSAFISTGNIENMEAFKILPNTHIINTPVQKTLIKAILNPPEPPFMVIAFTQSSADLCSQLRASYSKDIMYLCGNSVDRIDADIIRQSVSAITGAIISQKLLTSVASAYATIARGIATDTVIKQAQKTIYDAEEKSIGITEIIRSIPLAGSLEYRWMIACAYAKD